MITNEIILTSSATPNESSDIVVDVKKDGDIFNFNKTVNESTIRADTKSANKNSGSPLRYTDEKLTKQGYERLDAEESASFEKIRSSSITDSIQLGIRQSLGSLPTEPERDILMLDFMTVESTSFTTKGMPGISNSAEFVFKTYASKAFRYFRDLFGIKPECFVSSFCDKPLVELPNPGKSGSLFYLTQNDMFITKSIQHSELVFMQKLLPGYYLNLNQNPQTLLPKFFGLFCYKCRSKQINLAVMNNVLPSSIEIHQQFDLKGSTYNRKASKTELLKNSPTLKDLDFLSNYPEGIFLDNELYNKLLKIIERDCRVLESFEIMDYSLLLGIHNLDLDKRQQLHTCQIEDTFTEEGRNKRSEDGEGVEQINKKIKLTEKDSLNYKTPNSTFLKHDNSLFSGIPARKANGERLLLFLGIIDILQSYRVRKKVEHVLKSVIHRGSEISVHNPTFYAKRFKQFLASTVFKPMPPTPSKSTVNRNA